MHLEAYFIMDSDLAKDSNMEISVHALMLDLVAPMIRDKGGAVPRTLINAIDNTAREGKNQFFMSYLNFLVASNKFEATETEYMKPGHSHNEQDQRFSTIATTLSSAPVLETPGAFRDWIYEHVHPVQGRKLHVQVLESTMECNK